MSCRLSEHYIDGMLAIQLENDLITVGVLADRGSDIYEFRYKPKDIDFLLRLRKGEYEQAGEDFRTHRMKGKLELGNDTEIPAAAA